MGKKKLAAVALFACLAAGGGVWGGLKLLEKTWPSRTKELAGEISQKFQESGAPSKEVADKAATCVAEALAAAAAEAQCSPEGDSALKAVEQCMQSHQEVAMTLMMVLPACVAESL